MRALLLLTAFTLVAFCPAWYAPAAFAQQEDAAALPQAQDAPAAGEGDPDPAAPSVERDADAPESEGPGAIYRWTDTEGALHYTKDPLQVPVLLQGLLGEAPPGPAQEPGVASDFVAKAEGEAEAAGADDAAEGRPGASPDTADLLEEADPGEEGEGAEGAPGAGRETPEEP